MLKRVPEMQAEIREATCHEPYITHKQLMGYAYCLMDYGVRHQWMGGQPAGVLIPAARQLLAQEGGSTSLCPAINRLVPPHPPFAAAYIDIDEFFVFYDSTPDLPTLLHEYEGYGGLAVNWRMFGSSG